MKKTMDRIAVAAFFAAIIAGLYAAGFFSVTVARADTFIIFEHGANGAEKETWREKNVAPDICQAMAESVWADAHKRDLPALDAACLPD